MNLKFKAFSLLEISIYISIVGILMLSLAKTKDIILNTKIQTTILQMQTIIINPNEDFENIKPKIGGVFLLENDILILAKDKDQNGFLTKTVAEKFLAKLEENCAIEKTSNDLYIVTIKLL